MGKNKQKNQSRKKANLKRKRRNKHQKELERKRELGYLPWSQRLKPLPKAAPRKTENEHPPLLKYVPSHLPCEDDGDPDHHLTCPFFELEAWPLPDQLVTRDTRITSTFQNIYLEAASLIQSDLNPNGTMVCALNRVSETGTKTWFRCQLPIEHEVLTKWRLKIENHLANQSEPPKENEKALFCTQPIGPLRLQGTIVGVDDYGVQLSSGRLPGTDVAFVLQDATLEHMT